MTETVDVDLDALAPQLKRVKLAGKVWKLPGDLPMPLFLRMQRYEQRVKAGEDEGKMLEEIAGELLALFQTHQPQLKQLPGTGPNDRPQLGLTVLLQAIGTIYSGAEGKPPPAPPKAKKRKTTRTASAARRAAAAT